MYNKYHENSIKTVQVFTDISWIYYANIDTIAHNRKQQLSLELNGTDHKKCTLLINFKFQKSIKTKSTNKNKHQMLGW